MLLAAAGLLDGYQAATHGTSFRAFKSTFRKSKLRPDTLGMSVTEIVSQAVEYPQTLMRH
jgi:transcriptional regulator GlxA family with amidase domain